MLKKIIQLRKQLHQQPDLSGEESGTARIIRDFVESNHNTTIISGLGGNGMAVIYSFAEEGPSVMIRCELDALPITEANDFSHKSEKAGISHKCGHDGHMSIVAGLIFWIKEQDFKKGKIILLFQPAEETGKGAYEVLHDPQFKDLNPDYIFALHNLPGEPLNSIITVKGSFSSTVQSMAIYLTGKQSHASEPEKGINPAAAMAEIVSRAAEMNVTDPGDDSFALLTPVHMKMGSIAYGISPGEGELHYTMRTASEEVMKQLKERLIDIVSRVCKEYKLEFSTDWFDHFPATVNNDECIKMIVRAAKENGTELIQKPHAFKFGEDFGWFSQSGKAAMFGLGAGLNSPALHHADYDFPDEIIETGINMFSRIIRQILDVSDE